MTQSKTQRLKHISNIFTTIYFIKTFNHKNILNQKDDSLKKSTMTQADFYVCFLQ